MAYRKGAFDPKRVQAIESLGYDADTVLAACASVAIEEGLRVVDVVDDWLAAKRLLYSDEDIVEVMMPEAVNPVPGLTAWADGTPF